MCAPERWSITWSTPEGQLEAREPTRAEVEVVAAYLSAWYNDDHNRAMMSNEEAMASDEVRAHYDSVWEEGGRNFLLYAGGSLVGDADLRHVAPEAHTAEFAILIGVRDLQGRGFGTRFALMLHALAFGELGLDRIYVSIVPANRGSLRLFEKLGYQRDDSPIARAYIDENDDVTLSLERQDFLRRHGEKLHALSAARLG